MRLEDDRDFKAFVYQHLLDFTPYLPPESQVAVLAEDQTEDDREMKLTLVVSLAGEMMQVTGEADNPYDAFKAAKAQMIERFEDSLEEDDDGS